MADIHGIPSEADVTPVQSFTSEPLPDLGATFDAANALTGSGVLYPMSPRQAETEALLKSPPGYQDFDIYGGFSGQGSTTHGWPNNVGPVDDPDNGGWGGA